MFETIVCDSFQAGGDLKETGVRMGKHQITFDITEEPLKTSTRQTDQM